MLKNFKTLLLLLVAVIATVMPGLALAQAGVVTPPGSLTDWDLYVYGNGRVVYDIMMAIKMLMVPDSGNTGFTSLLLVMATMGFVVLAIAAGFDPGKNIIKLFSYILVVWGVTFATTKLTANVVIQDLARGPDGAGVADLRVEGAPALVVLPAALTSEVGRYFTQVIETYFTMPGEMKMSGQGVGQFNLFGRMMQEANQYVITSPELKKSLSSYAANCVVPALALGRVQGPVGSGTSATTAYGTDALLRSNDMMTVLESAKSKSMLTKYYPYDALDVSWKTVAGTEADGLAFTADDLKRYQGSGVLLSCDSAFEAIKHDVDKNAQLLMDKGADAWSKTGVMVPYETAFQTMLGQAAAPGAAAASFGSPKGFIMQQALINSTNGAYRQAAIQTGNNELMQAAAIAQAEVSQKSAWAASFAVFNNMMGYVFTVLQAFIFAITPLIVIALMIPGLGSKIFVNYAQILIWLTLWQPMLSLINFIITLFGAESVSTVVSPEGGLSMANKALVTEKTNDLMVAAQFLGTMTPLLSWGIVKGAMAFTEFINSGVGSAFASQAGATAATGNLSMNNMSLDNTSMHKYSTAMSSQVGAQAVSVGANAGAMNVGADAGGSSMKMNDSGVNFSRQAQESYQKALAENKAIASVLQSMDSKQLSLADVRSKAADSSLSSAEQKAYQRVLAAAESMGLSDKAGGGKATADSASLSQAQKEELGRREANQYTASANVGANTPIGGASIGGGNTRTNDTSDSTSTGADNNRNATVTTNMEQGALSRGNGLSDTTSATTGSTTTVGGSASTRASSDESASISKAISAAQSQTDQISQSLTKASSVTDSFSYSNPMSFETFKQHEANAQALMGGMQSAAAGMEGRMAAGEAGLGSSMAATGAAVDASRAGSQGQLASLTAGAGGHGPGSVMGAHASRVQQGMVERGAELDTRMAAVSSAVDGRKAEAGAQMARGPKERTTTPFGVDLPNAPGAPVHSGPTSVKGKTEQGMFAR